jgi:choice-of-anchor B domain-containing protein
MVRRAILAALALLLWSASSLLITAGGAAAVPADASPRAEAAPRAAAAATPCTNGMAGSYPCRNVDLQSNVPLANMGGGSGAGGWGWTDPSTGKEYAIVARSNGTSFVDISNPTSPVYLGNLPSPTGTSNWRELTVHNNTVYIVADNNGSHGLQVFDLTKLRTVTSPPVTFTHDARDTSFTHGHTVSVNPDSGYLYVNGSNTCSGGPRMFNLANRLAPAFAGCVSGDGYSHDSSAVMYHGPDSRYTGKEIMVGSNEDTITVFDVTTKSSPTQLARKGYAGSGYTHQGWFTEDHKYFLVDDETDETSNGHNTYTYVWNMSDLTNPVLVGKFVGPTAATDHNQFVKGNYSYQANYKAGLRIVDLANIASPASMSEAAYFDTYPANNSNGFDGAWHNYPYYPSGNVAIFTIDRGLFVVKPNLGTPSNNFSLTTTPTAGSADPGGSVTTTVNTAVTSGSAETVTLSATGLPSGATASFNPSSVTAGASSTLTISTSGSTPPGSYPITVKGTAPSASQTSTYTLTVNGPAGCSGTNGNDVAIPDNATVESSITISGCSGNGSAGSTVEVHIQHTYIGDLVVSLIAPDGSSYVLHNRAGSGTDNIDKTYTVDLSAEAANGTWKLRVRDAATADVGKIDSWRLNLGTAPPPPGCSGTNGNNVTIPDNQTVSSQIAISGCTGNASATSTVAVKIQHTYIGDLVVTLVAPDGSSYTLQNRSGGSADNIDKTYPVNLSNEVRNGTWTLRVQDAASADTGFIDSWTLTL